MTVLILIYCKLLFTREEAAEALSISPRKLDDLVTRGELEPRRIDSAVRFYVGELVRFAVENHTETTGQDAKGAENDHEA
jgi:hypothetical protein